MCYQAILLDLDGTIVDSSRGITNAFIHALRYYHIERTPQQLRRYIGPPLHDSFRELCGLTTDRQAQQAVEHYREYYRDRGVLENDLIDGIEPFLQACKAAGKQVVLATSKPIVFADRILNTMGLFRYFDGTFGSELNGERSAKCEVIAYAMEQMHLDPATCLMVGDRKHDIDGAHACGVKAAGITLGFGSREELEGAGAEYVCESFEQVLSVALG